MGNSMKKPENYIILALLTVVLSNCKPADNKSTDSKTRDTISKLSVKADTLTLKTDLFNQDLKFCGHKISFYLTNRQIPQVCKDIFTKKIPVSDDIEVLSLMDSIFTNNKDTGPFYFLTLTQTMEKADGAYAEPLGVMCRKFIETRTKEFFDYFINEPMLTDQNFSEWAQLVAGEIAISAEGHEKNEADKLIRKMAANSRPGNEKQKEKLKEFSKMIVNLCP